MPDAPDELRVAAYFDFAAHPFEHEALFHRAGVETVVDALGQIAPYCAEWLAAQHGPACRVERIDGVAVHVEAGAVFQPGRVFGGGRPGRIIVGAGAVVRGGEYDVAAGDVHIGAGASLWGAWIAGPALIGCGTEIRPGAYLRGGVIIGRNDVIRGELKNAVVMDNAQFPHPSYLGDSICGYGSHFGNQATAANVNVFGGHGTIKITVNGRRIDLGRRKVGIILGDYAQVGCNAVSDPGTFLRPRTIVYPLTRINSGVYGPGEVLKNKPMEHGVIERARLRDE